MSSEPYKCRVCGKLRPTSGMVLDPAYCQGHLQGHENPQGKFHLRLGLPTAHTHHTECR